MSTNRVENSNSGQISRSTTRVSRKVQGEAIQTSFARRSVLEELDQAVQYVLALNQEAVQTHFDTCLSRSIPQITHIRTQARTQAHAHVFARACPNPAPLNLINTRVAPHAPHASSLTTRPLNMKPAANASRRHGLSMPKKSPSVSPPQSRSKRNGRLMSPSPSSSPASPPISCPAKSVTTTDDIAEAIALAMLRGGDSGSSGDETEGSECTHMADDEAKSRRDKALKDKERARAREKAGGVAGRRKSAMLMAMPSNTTALALRARSKSANKSRSNNGKIQMHLEKDVARVPRLLRV